MKIVSQGVNILDSEKQIIKEGNVKNFYIKRDSICLNYITNVFYKLLNYRQELDEVSL